jgi:aminobenzoyl-glutamate utilization protein B
MEFRTACNVNGAPGHSWQFTACSGSSIGHKSLIFAAKTMAASVLDLMQKPELVKKAKKEHKKRLRGREYQRDPTVEPPLEKARELAKTYQSKK